MLSAVSPICAVFYIIIFQVHAQGIAELRLKMKNRWNAMTKILFSCESGSRQVHLAWKKASVASDTIFLARNTAESARPRKIALLQQ